jgi:hypothetical protein
MRLITSLELALSQEMLAALKSYYTSNGWTLRLLSLAYLLLLWSFGLRLLASERLQVHSRQG